jgi:hypothetical protein
MRKLLRLLLGVLIVLAVGLTTAPAAQAATRPYCGIYWGSLVKTGGGLTSVPSGSDSVYNVRTGRHACYDRLVVDVSGPIGSYNVRYVTQIASDGGGIPVPTRGGAALRISVMNSGYDQYRTPTYVPANSHELTNVRAYRTFRQIVWAGSYEGYSTVGIGVRARLPFRVFTLAGPGSNSRLVVDVAHRW